MSYFLLRSSHGIIRVSADVGLVTAKHLSSAWEGAYPAKIDVEEWHKRYPNEDICQFGEHDILDFGYWMSDGAYEPPCENWRIGRAERRKQEAEYDASHPWKPVADDCVHTVWKCSKCGFIVITTMSSMLDAGLPYCAECEEDMGYLRTEIKK